MKKKGKTFHAKKTKSIISAVLFALELIVFIATVLMIKLESSASWNIDCNRITSAYDFWEGLLVKDNSHIMDGFCLLWGMTVTIVLFLIESGNIYWYGMRFKHIIEVSINKSVLIIGAIEYIILCPATYILEAKGLYKACLWCIVLTFLVFAAIPFYAIAVTGKRMINRLILNESVKRLRRVIEERESRYIEMEMQQLPISSVIMNTSYEDSQEVEQLIMTIQKVFHKKKIDSMISHTFFDYVIVMTWVEQIVEKSGFCTEREKERTIYILKRLWEAIKKELRSVEPDKKKRDYKLLAYAVEILLPLFYRETEDTNRIFISVWGNMEEIRFKVMPYLFLYVEFCHRDYRQEFYKKYYDIFRSIERDGKRFKIECGLWKRQQERQLAGKFWLAWTACRDGSNDIGLTNFIEFCHDVEMISQNNITAVRTYTMKKIRNMLR